MAPAWGTSFGIAWGNSWGNAGVVVEQPTQQLGIYGNQHNQRRIQEANRQIMEVILRAAPYVFSNHYK